MKNDYITDNNSKLLLKSHNTYHPSLIDLTGLIITNRPDEVNSHKRSQSVPFLSNCHPHEPLGYRPCKDEPIAKFNIKRINYYLILY